MEAAGGVDPPGEGEAQPADGDGGEGEDESGEEDARDRSGARDERDCGEDREALADADDGGGGELGARDRPARGGADEDALEEPLVAVFDERHAGEDGGEEDDEQGDAGGEHGGVAGLGIGVRGVAPEAGEPRGEEDPDHHRRGERGDDLAGAAHEPDEFSAEEGEEGVHAGGPPSFDEASGAVSSPRPTIAA